MRKRAPRGESVLEVQNLCLSFPGLRGGRVQILDNVSFEVGRRETVGLVGQSGSGKTMTALSIMRLNPPTSTIDGGRVLLEGKDLLLSRGGKPPLYRGKRIGMIFQSPVSSLNPLIKVGKQIARVLQLHRDASSDEAKDLSVEFMKSAGINDADRRWHAYPHQLSGGMAQRVMIAMALAPEPEILVADEPTTALDVTIQDQIFELLLELQERMHMSILLITHDLAVVAETCDRVVVMNEGRVVEIGSVETIFEQPRDPYTRGLVGSALRPDKRRERRKRPEELGESA
jgi:ABC-type dipeptide/oligopeptide/nickel transport system ATPase component